MDRVSGLLRLKLVLVQRRSRRKDKGVAHCVARRFYKGQWFYKIVTERDSFGLMVVSEQVGSLNF